MKQARGFTLIELLVVISIVGMLSSVVIASTQDARERGRIAGGIIFATHVHQGYGDQANGYWSLNDTMDDSSGNNRTAIKINNPTFVSDRYSKNGKSLSLNRNSNQYIEFADGDSSVFATKNITISAWIKTSTNVNADYQTIISYYPYYTLALCSGGYPAAYGGGTNFMYWRTPHENACPPIKGTQSLVDGKWHQVTMTTKIGVTNGTILYVDGRAVATGTIDDRGTYEDTGELSVGSKRWGSASFAHGFTGLIADIVIYPTSLIATETEKSYTRQVFGHSLATLF